MTPPSRTIPHSRLDALHTLLTGYSSDDDTFQIAFAHLISGLGSLALPELDKGLKAGQSLPELRKEILESAHIPWPKWEKPLVSLLRTEKNLEVFEKAANALGALLTRNALESLKELKEHCHDTEKQKILSLELAHYFSEDTFSDCLDTLQDCSDPGTAQQCAKRLAVLTTQEVLPQLKAAFDAGKTPTKQLLLRVIAFSGDSASEPLLLDTFRQLLQEGIDCIEPEQRKDLSALLETLSNLLEARVEAGVLNPDLILPLMEKAFHHSLGGNDLLINYLNLIPTEDTPRIEKLLSEPDAERRKLCYETLGARKDDRLASHFINAMSDPVKEVGLVAMEQLEKLPSGISSILQLLGSDQIELAREAIRFFKDNHITAAVKPLTTLLTSEGHDSLLADAASALGSIGDPSATSALLQQLHAGKPLSLQVAIIEALSDLKASEASIELLKKSNDLILPEVLLLSLKCALSAFPSFDKPFPKEQVHALEHLVQRCCDTREGGGNSLNTALALQALFVCDAKVYERMTDRFDTLLFELREKSSTSKSYETLSEAMNNLNKRAVSYTTLKDKEIKLQSAINEIPDVGPKRTQTLQQLNDFFNDPKNIFSNEFSKHVIELIQREFSKEKIEILEAEILCNISKFLNKEQILYTIDNLYIFSEGYGLRTAARKALLALGMPEKNIDQKRPINSVLLLEPNSFFRKKVLLALEALNISVEAAANREGAHEKLAENPVDLLISETQDPDGELWSWVETERKKKRYRYVLFSTANPEHSELENKPWIIARLNKPYHFDTLLDLIRSN